VSHSIAGATRCAVVEHVTRIRIGGESRAVGAVAFDLDGTLTRPYLNFALLRTRLGSGSGDILKWAATLPPNERLQAFREIEAFEQDGVRHAKWNAGALETLGALRELGVPVAIVTRNSRSSLDAVCGRLGIPADLRVAREDAPVKPDPACVRHVAWRLGVSVGSILVVGDFHHDVEAGRAAGAMTALLTNGNTPEWPVEADFVIERIDHILAYLH